MIAPDPAILERKRQATKLEDLIKLRKEEKLRTSQRRSQGLQKWKERTMGAYVKTLVRE
jgi:hypothetical protein